MIKLLRGGVSAVSNWGVKFDCWQHKKLHSGDCCETDCCVCGSGLCVACQTVTANSNNGSGVRVCDNCPPQTRQPDSP